MSELYHFIGENRDVPAGDIGVGAREIGYLFGQCKRLTHRFESGALTGKKASLGGSLARTEATGFGAVYFAKAMLGTVSESLQGKTAVVSGSGNVAIYCAKKLTELEAKTLFQNKDLLFAPGKAANAGGVAVSALEMQQNASLQSWSFSEVDRQLQAIMATIHQDCQFYAQKHKRPKDYVFGANVAGFLRVADAVHSYGVI